MWKFYCQHTFRQKFRENNFSLHFPEYFSIGSAFLAFPHSTQLHIVEITEILFHKQAFIWQKFRESKVFTKEVVRELISRNNS